MTSSSKPKPAAARTPLSAEQLKSVAGGGSWLPTKPEAISGGAADLSAQMVAAQASLAQHGFDGMHNLSPGRPAQPQADLQKFAQMFAPPPTDPKTDK